LLHVNSQTGTADMVAAPAATVATGAGVEMAGEVVVVVVVLPFMLLSSMSTRSAVLLLLVAVLSAPILAVAFLSKSIRCNTQKRRTAMSVVVRR